MCLRDLGWQTLYPLFQLRIQATHLPNLILENEVDCLTPGTARQTPCPPRLVEFPLFVIFVHLNVRITCQYLHVGTFAAATTFGVDILRLFGLHAVPPTRDQVAEQVYSGTTRHTS